MSSSSEYMDWDYHDEPVAETKPFSDPLSYYDQEYLYQDVPGYDTTTLAYTGSAVVLAVVGMLGSVAVLVLACRHRKNSTPASLYLLNCVLADLLVQLFSPLLVLNENYENKNFKLGRVWCSLASIFLQVGTLVSTIFFILFAIDCYLASRPVHHSMQYRWKMLRVGVGLTWGLGGLGMTLTAGITSLFFSPSFTDYNTVGQPQILICNLFPMFYTPFLLMKALMPALMLVVPLVVLYTMVAFLYTPGTRKLGNDNKSLQELNQNRRLILAMTLAFSITQAPFLIANPLYYLFWFPFNQISHWNIVLLWQLLYILTPYLILCLGVDFKRSVPCCQAHRHGDHEFEFLPHQAQ